MSAGCRVAAASPWAQPSPSPSSPAGRRAGAMADPGAVYTQTNDRPATSCRRSTAIARASSRRPGRSTGGVGLAALGGRQGAVELSDDESTVYAVNGGSNSVSVFDAGRSGLALEDVALSGGVAPNKRRRAPAAACTCSTRAAHRT